MKRASVMGFCTVGLVVAALAAADGKAKASPYTQAGGQQGQQQTGSQQAKPATGQPGAAQARLGTISLPRNVMADGKPLPAGTYQLRLTGEEASPTPPGQTPGAERWVEFLRGGKVVGRELATVVPDSEIAQIAEGHGKPARNGQRVDLLKAQKYWRVWMHRGNTHYLIHLPPAEKGNG